MTSPAVLYDVSQLVLDCVCAKMTEVAEDDESYPGCPCFSFVSPGEPQLECCTQDDCGSEGMLAVHIEDTFPSDVFPNQADTFDPCKAATWVTQMVVTVARCVPIVQEDGSHPKPEDVSAAARVQMMDEWAVLQALTCCLVAEALPNKRRRRVQLIGASPNLSEGGCGAIEVRAFVEVAVRCGCPGEGS